MIPTTCGTAHLVDCEPDGGEPALTDLALEIDARPREAVNLEASTAGRGRIGRRGGVARGAVAADAESVHWCQLDLRQVAGRCA